ncbi:hypothetical protein [Streptomyces caatingaensis]|uniref:hypothetical protein n=1 Tax=Streptomyces caatingaensis TaxID=1678637 RepID=UPI000A64E973|nr:hypothetical protein [Streptomyces caatingaensis]
MAGKSPGKRRTIDGNRGIPRILRDADIVGVPWNDPHGHPDDGPAVVARSWTARPA